MFMYQLKNFIISDFIFIFFLEENATIFKRLLL